MSLAIGCGEKIIAPPITPELGVTTTSVTVSAAQGDSIAQSITVSGEEPTAWTAAANVPWISVSPSSGVTPSTVSVDTRTTGLTVGSHTGNVVINSPGLAPISIVVTLTVTAPTLTVSPAAINLTGVAGSTIFPPQAIAIGTGGSATLQWSATGSASWVTVAPSTGTGPGTVSVGIDGTTMTAGTYQGILTVTASGASNSPQTVPISVVLSPPPNVDVAISSSPVAGGTTSGGGTYPTGASVTVTALATAGWTFTNWTLNGTVVSTNRTYTFTANANAPLVANFTENAADVVVTPTASPAAGGNVAGGGNYAAGVEVTLNAAPAAGYAFVNWTVNGDEVAINPQFGFVATTSVSPVAHFRAVAPPGIVVVTTPVDPVNGGTVTGGGSYVVGAPVTLVATPAPGYVFSAWREISNITPIVSRSATFSFPARDWTLQAEFNRAPNTFTVTTTSNPAAGGTTTGSGTYSVNADVWAVATANPGYTFTNWTRNGVPVSVSASYFMLSPGSGLPAGSDIPLVANFTANQPGGFVITASSSPAAGGSTTGTGSYATGTSVTLKATPAPTYVFTNWTLSGAVVSTSATYIFAANANADLVAHFVVPASFTVTTTADPTAGGTTTGGGSFAPGASATVTATPASGYMFTGWTMNGVGVTGGTTYTFTVTADAPLVAHFALIPVSITTSASPAAGGSTSGAGLYTPGSSVTVTAVPAAGATFLSWTVNGTVVSTNAAYTFTASVARSLVANFTTSPTVTLTTGVNPTFGGTVTPGGTYPVGSDVTITAVPAPGYRFVNWKINGADAWVIPSFVHTATGDATIVAQFTAFAPPGLSVITTEVSPFNGGIVSGGGNYVFGSTVTLVATPAPGYAFLEWRQITTITPVISRTATYTFAANGDQTLRAIFQALPQRTVTTSSSPAAGGTTTGAGSYPSGSSVTATATPAVGYTFTNWTVSGAVVSTSPSYTFTANANTALVANFTAVTSGNFAITTSSSPGSGGTTTGGGSYASGASVTVIATPAMNYTFTNWTLNGTAVSSSASYTFAVTADASLVANFTTVARIPVTVTASPVDGGYVAASGDGTYLPGEMATVGAAPYAGYAFVSWSINGAVVSTSVNFTFQVTAPVTVVGTFAPLPQRVVSLSSAPAAGGTTTGSGTYYDGKVVTIEATENPGWQFVGWNEGGQMKPYPQTYSLTVRANTNLIAFFRQLFTVTTSSNPAAGGATGGGGVIADGSTATVTAVANAGYTFTNWTRNGTVVSTNAVYSFTVQADAAVVANFTPNP